MALRGQAVSHAGGVTSPGSRQELCNHDAGNPCGADQTQASLYAEKSGSYDRRDGRESPPSQKTSKKIRRQAEAIPADLNLITDRQRLVALLAQLPDEVLAATYPTIEATLKKAARRPNFKANGHRQDCATKNQLPEFRLATAQCSRVRHGNGKVKQLPRLVPPDRWPNKKFNKEFRRHGISIVDFLRAEWSTLVAAGYGELRWLRMVDPSAAAAVENYERVDPKTKKRKQLPPDVRFMRERDVVNLKLAMGLDAALPDPRLLDAAARRLRRGFPLIITP